VVSQPFTVGGNQSYPELWAVTDEAPLALSSYPDNGDQLLLIKDLLVGRGMERKFLRKFKKERRSSIW
jgi:hypothetical protein